MSYKTKKQFAVKISNLSKTYRNGLVALKNVNLRIEEGDVHALLGVNGAGKTTIIKIITSLVQQTTGRVEICGTDKDLEPYLARSKVGVVPQEFNLNLFETPLRILRKQAGLYGLLRQDKRIKDILSALNLEDKMDSQVRSLSGGMKRRLMIARSMIHDPELLILDEPTAGVDIELRHKIFEFIREINNAGTTIILTTHYLEEAESLCKNVSIISSGEIIVSSKMKELVSSISTQRFSFTTKCPLPATMRIPNFSTTRINEYTLEVTFDSMSSNLNGFFQAIEGLGIEVESIVNKSNKLETYFLQLTKSNV